MKKYPKVIARYLPQYHEIPENSLFWGEGFTDWVSVKKATPLYKEHMQPVIPLNNNYYDLSLESTLQWQVELAKKYKIYGFGIYHYWFNSDKVLLTKPVENLYNNKELDIHYFLSWDNANWRRTWSKFRGNAWAPIEDEANQNKESSILIKYDLGNETDWKKHFNYLLKYFMDERYIKVDNKPLFEVFNYSKDIHKMAILWDKMARFNGFNGIEIVYKNSPINIVHKDAKTFRYEPIYSGWGSWWSIWKTRLLSMLGMMKNGPYLYSYDEVWKKIIYNAKNKKNVNQYYGGVVAYDDTPRRGKQGKVLVGASPEKFELYFKQLYDICKNQSKEFIMLTAWNEWGEGAQLEPTSKYEYRFLEAIKRVVEDDG